jgi:outer membrane protein OmpA-like peptidoglycan-associated protein
VPRAAVTTGGGVIELVALWRRGPNVRMVVSGQVRADGFELAGRFGPAGQHLRRAMLVDPATRTAYPVRTTAAGPRQVAACLCSTAIVTARLRALYYADFLVPETVADVLALGDDGPPFGRVRIATASGDLVGAGYTWLSGPPPELGSVPADDGRARSALVDVREQPGGATTVGAPDRLALGLPADMLFAVGSATLDPGTRERLSGAVAALRRLPAGTTVTVAGHTDDQGTAAFNLRLSRERADAVAAVLRAGLTGTTVAVRAEGRGETEPLAPNTGDDGRPLATNRARNRRVEIEVPPGTAIPDRPAVPPTALPADASTVPPTADEVAAVELVPHEPTGERFRLAVTRVRSERDLGLVRVDLRLTYTGSNDRARRSLRAAEALALPTDRAGNGARELRLIDPASGVRAAPTADQQGDCLCADEIAHPLVLGEPDGLSVWFPWPAGEARTVNLVVPRAGLLRDLPVGS